MKYVIKAYYTTVAVDFMMSPVFFFSNVLDSLFRVKIEYEYKLSLDEHEKYEG